MSVTDDANELHGIFGSTRTGQHYARLDVLLVNAQPNAVSAIYNEYERLYNSGSFGRDLRTFCGNIQGDAQMQTSMRDRYVARLAQAGIIVYPGSAPAAVALLPTAQNRPVWRQRWIAYFTSGQGMGYQPKHDKRLFLWILHNWVSIRTGAMSNSVQGCRWQPQENQLFRASFSFLSQDSRAQEQGRLEGIAYFMSIADAVHLQFATVLNDAANYQEVYQARTHPFFLANPSARVPPIDNTRLLPRMRCWTALFQRSDPIPLNPIESRRIRYFPTLQSCWSQNPSPIHPCSAEARCAGVQTIGAGP